MAGIIGKEKAKALSGFGCMMLFGQYAEAIALVAYAFGKKKKKKKNIIKKKIKKKKRRPAGREPQGPQPKGNPLFLKAAPPRGGDLPLFFPLLWRVNWRPFGLNPGSKLVFPGGENFFSPPPQFPHPNHNQNPEKN
eukprot:FR740210.1.p2 GENE.FR740210.1~~FR740210.1.p2  ORF type:complete len:136 (+),score=79.18 FR740210.1:737-1144(+)